MSATTTKALPTLEQRRANHAWEAVANAKNKYKTDLDKAKRFGGHAKKLPTRIIASGLGQALAFLKAKDYAPDLLLALSKWVLFVRDEKEPPGNIKDDALLLAVIKGNSDFLRRATDEVLAYLLWLNRFAEAEKLTEND
jgi:CRISPR-associated protein Cmr5